MIPLSCHSDMNQRFFKMRDEPRDIRRGSGFPRLEPKLPGKKVRRLPLRLSQRFPHLIRADLDRLREVKARHFGVSRNRRGLREQRGGRRRSGPERIDLRPELVVIARERPGVADAFQRFSK